MAPPKPAPIAAPRRGKFLSAPSPSPTSSVPNTPSSTGSKTRGKFLNKTSASPSSSQGAAASSNTAGDVDGDSLGNVRSQIHNSKVAASSRRKALAGQREQVYQDLDEAENIVLSLLECASDVAGALSEMTTAKSKETKVKPEDGEAKQSFEELTTTVRSNGVGYLAGVKKLHKLLAPHASLVKSYKSHDKGDSDEGDNPPHKSLATVLPGTASGISGKIVQEATSNMYAARVKKRLAVERNEILTDMIRLEELDGEGGGGDKKQNERVGSAGSKRKHESMGKK